MHIKDNIFGLAAVALAMASGAAAQDQPISLEGPPAIIVTGHGVASAPPELGHVALVIRGEGHIQTEALQALADSQAKVEGGLKRLEGVARLKLETANVIVSPAHAAACPNDTDAYPSEPRLSTGPCAVAGWVATMDVAVEIAPARIVGNAASLAGELGAYGVLIGPSSVDDDAGLHSLAVTNALEAAHARASAIAAASGVRLGPVIRIEDANPLDLPLRVGPATAKALPPPPAQPSIRARVPLETALAPVTRAADFTVVYAIEK